MPIPFFNPNTFCTNRNLKIVTTHGIRRFYGECSYASERIYKLTVTSTEIRIPISAI